MRTREFIIEKLLLVSALSSVSMLGLIALFVFIEGTPIIAREGPISFLFGNTWAPTKGHFGIFPMVLGSIWVTIGSLIIAGPLGVACSVFLVEIAPRRVADLMRPAIQLLAGIPSVVYGFVGIIVLVPLIRETLGGPGLSVLAATVILGVMVLPTVISISQDALEAVPNTYREGALALGLTQWQAITRVVLPAARGGITAALVLGMGRAIGETMAVIMVVGNAAQLPVSPLDPARTLTSNIALEMAYAAGEHREALFATGVVLFVFIMILNTLASLRARRRGER
ncbi:MAG: phosphate ABC transporter permease subunit PstC [Armatimonadetes bacterium]|nr:phosphate ABC transporter permease subunit PstC [Armatimonadota bacterium]MDI9586662.1 phosphate ABC transporter permease subunit PstC [Acidobacteriota bacterium]